METTRNPIEPGAAQAAVPPTVSKPGAGGAGATAAPISTVYDLKLPVTVELGRTKMTIQEVLGLTRGSVIELDRLVGEPIDIYAGDRRFAEGEVVVIGEQFGVRITRILTQTPEWRANG
jgi:flagellar motor switch protein FliN/FliY